jgi:hypothetical protein
MHIGAKCKPGQLFSCTLVRCYVLKFDDSVGSIPRANGVNNDVIIEFLQSWRQGVSTIDLDSHQLSITLIINLQAAFRIANRI